MSEQTPLRRAARLCAAAAAALLLCLAAAWLCPARAEARYTAPGRSVPLKPQIAFGRRGSMSSVSEP